MADLIFSQGATALLTAQFVTTAGQAVNVSDAQVTIYGLNADIILAPTFMTNVTTGFYYHDYTVPNTLPIGNYTVRYTGTVQGVASATTSSMQVLAAGTPAGLTTSAMSIALIARLSRYICCSLHVPILHLQGRANKDRDQYSFVFSNWNLSNPVIELNDIEVTEGFTIDYDNGTVTFDVPLLKTDTVHATFNFSWFTQLDLLSFLNDAISQINLEPAASEVTLDTIPDRWVGTLMQGAAANAIQAMLNCLQFQQPQKVFGDRDAARDAKEGFQSLKENFEKRFQEDKKTLKTKGPYPKIAVISTPEYTLPGGRSRWFRYLFSSNVG